MTDIEVEPVLISRSEAQEILGISHATMWRWCRSGKLTAYPGGKVDGLEVLDLRDQRAG